MIILSSFSTKDIKFTYIKDGHSLNIFSILVTEEVSKLDKSKDIKAFIS